MKYWKEYISLITLVILEFQNFVVLFFQHVKIDTILHVNKNIYFKDKSSFYKFLLNECDHFSIILLFAVHFGT